MASRPSRSRARKGSEAKPIDALQEVVRALHGDMSPDSMQRVRHLHENRMLHNLDPIRKFRSPPERQLYTVCFDFPGSSLLHRQVVNVIQVLLGPTKESKIIDVRFEARHVILGTSWSPNRWIIRLVDHVAFNVLVETWAHVSGEKVRIRDYDEVLQDEYQKYIDFKNNKKTTLPPLTTGKTKLSLYENKLMRDPTT